MDIYRFDIFKNTNIICATSTRNIGSIKDEDGNTIKRNLNKFARRLGIDAENMLFPKQTHSANISFIGKLRRNKLGNVDGLIANKKNIFLGVLTADCLPVCFVDKKRKLVGIIHAGYKGILRGIISKAVDRFKKLGSKTYDIEVAIGPAIGKCCYSVGIDRINLFKGKLGSFYVFEKRDGEHFLDLKETAVNILIYSGIATKNIEVSPICTKSDLPNFFSARGDKKGQHGRFATIIGRV